MLEFYVSYCTLPEIHRMYTEIVKQLQIFSDNLWAKSLRSKVYALFYVYAKKITQCFFVQKTATKSERSCYCSKEGMCISCFVSHMVKIGCFYKIQGCALSRVSCRVLNSWKSLEICPAIFQSWKIELKSRKMMKSHEFVSKLHQALYVILFLFGQILSNFTCLQCIMKKALFVRCLRPLLITYLITLSLEKVWLRPQLFKRWIALSTGYISLQWIVLSPAAAARNVVGCALCWLFISFSPL